MLCPIALDDAWKQKIGNQRQSAGSRRQLWRTLQQKLVVDFSQWTTEAYDESFQKLLRGLKTNYGPRSSRRSVTVLSVSQPQGGH